jgi:hypothetical protein
MYPPFLLPVYYLIILPQMVKTFFESQVKSQNCCKFGPGYIVTATASG